MKKDEREAIAAVLNISFDNLKRKLKLPGIEKPAHQAVLVQQLIDSMRRVQFVTVIRDSRLSEQCANPSSNAFDPVKAATYFFRIGKLDEAFWLAFLAIHFGKHKKSGWSLVKSVYGHLNEGEPWSWENVTQNYSVFDAWLADNFNRFSGYYGNHRKYETLKPGAVRSPSAVFASYVKWVGSQHSHIQLLERYAVGADRTPKKLFDDLYCSMRTVISFGRMARFDFLTMVGKLGFAAIEPGKAYLSGATGPRAGANLLFEGTTKGGLSIHTLDKNLAILYEALPLGTMGMQVLEDAICNWQKNRDKYILFRG